MSTGILTHLRNMHRPFSLIMATACLALLLPATGCRTANKTAAAQTPADAVPPPVTMDDAKTILPKAAVLDEKPLLVGDLEPELNANDKNEFNLPKRTSATPEPPKAEYPGSLLTEIKDPDTKLPVKINFDASPLTEVVPLFAELLKFSYLIDPGVKGTVSMTMDSEITAREVWEMFEHILWLSGAYASRNPGFIHIMPFAKMPQERRLLVQHEPMANVEVAFIPANYTKSADLITNVKPFMTEGATVTDIPRLNTLLIVETPTNMPKLRELISRLDIKGEADWPQIVVRCHSVDAELIRDELQALLPVLGLPVTDKAASGGEIKLTVLPRLQVIVASAAMKEVLDEVERWILLLDKENASEQQSIYFYNVRHSTADHLREAVGVFFNVSGSSSSKASTSKSTSSKAAKPGTDSPQTPPSPTSPQGQTNRRPAKEAGAITTIFDIPITVYADTEQNRLTILTSPRAYGMVEALLKRLDVPPRQVLIQATIAEITLDKSTSFGFNYAANMMIKGTTMKLALPNTRDIDLATLANNLPTTVKANSGIAFLMSNPDWDGIGFITAVAGEKNTKIISAPQIVAANDQEATINVGDKVPSLGEYQNSGTGTGTTSSYYSQSIQYLETGTILKVTPHITAGNEVNLDISQEVSSAIPSTGTSNIDSPTIQKRNLETKLVVPDGGTVLMGGMIRTLESDNHSGVPWFKDIPLIGRLFRDNAMINNRTEILVMITVNVIDENSDVDKLARSYQIALKAIRERLK